MKLTSPPSHQTAIYNKNVDLISAAALSLGYKVIPIEIGGKTDLDTFGFMVQAHKKTCYVSGKSFFPTIERWQAEFMKDKATTAKILEQRNYRQIPTLVFHPQVSYTNATIKKDIVTFALPLIIKPNYGLDGKGIVWCSSYASAIAQIKKLTNEEKTAIVQPFVDAPEYRIFVTDRQIAFIHRKRCPYVIGDGTQRILDLVQKATYSDPATVVNEAKKLGLKSSDILGEGVMLRTHFTKKADPDFLKTHSFGKVLTAYINRLCSDLSLDTVGLDVFFVGTMSNPQDVTIIELNSNPGLRYLTTYYPDTTIAFTTAQTILTNYFAKR